MSYRPNVGGLIAASLCFALVAACSDGDKDRNTDKNPGGGDDKETPIDGNTDGNTDTQVCPTTPDCSIAACAGRVCGNGGACENLKCVEPIADSQIGDSCSGATQANQAGTCVGDGMICSAIEYLAFSRLKDGAQENQTCTKECTTNSDCGTTNGVSNTCQPLGDFSICIRGCTPGGTDCPGAAQCLTFGSSMNACVSPCSSNADCTYGMTCADAGGGTKVCNPDGCGAGGTCNGTNRVCDVSQKNQNFPNGLCVDKCTSTSCENGRFCNDDGVCEVPGGTYYNACQNNNDCESDGLCVGPEAGGVCLQDCTESNGCGGEPAGALCAIGLQSGRYVCALPCTKNEDCQNTTCESLGGGSQKFCLP